VRGPGASNEEEESSDVDGMDVATLLLGLDAVGGTFFAFDGGYFT
jgi:hypothetical protein